MSPQKSSSRLSLRPDRDPRYRRSRRRRSRGGGTAALQLKVSLRGHDYATQDQTRAPDGGKSGGAPSVYKAAAHAVSGTGGKLPAADKIQQSFGCICRACSTRTCSIWFRKSGSSPFEVLGHFFSSDQLRHENPGFRASELAMGIRLSGLAHRAPEIGPGAPRDRGGTTT